VIKFDLYALDTVTNFSVSDAGAVSYYVEPRYQGLEEFAAILGVIVEGALAAPGTVYRELRGELERLELGDVRETEYSVGGSSLVH
jgi:hypothetical protein